MSDYVMQGHRAVTRGLMKWSFDQEATATVTYSGPYEMILAARPERGTPFDEYPALLVVSVTIDEKEGGAGEMTVNFKLFNYQPDSVSTAPIAEPEFEVSFNEEKIAIRCHPKCGEVDEGSVEAEHKGLTIDDWEIIKENPSYYIQNSDDDWSAETYTAIRSAGVEDYLVSAPVVTRTLYYFNPPTDVGANCFKREMPPDSSFEELDRYDWLKGTDTTTKQGRVWRRQTQWIGAEIVGDGGGGWNPDIYPDAD